MSEEIILKKLDRNLAFDLMSVPTYSGYEFRMVSFITLWAVKNNISYEFDNYGNLYLTKGELEEGEFYPCVTAHLDSVQSAHKPYILEGSLIPIIESTTKEGKTSWTSDGMGLGGDDKCGLLISLSLFEHVNKLKAAFFLEEETGCRGSSQLNVSFFDNVGYVMGFDSPDTNRNAWSCSGKQLFSKDFYQNHMKEVCDKHGRTLFQSEPYTDVKEIREKVDLICMNFGSGYYNAHANNEYVVLEDIDDTIEFSLDLINSLGRVRYSLEKGLSSYSSNNLKWNYETKKYESKSDSSYDNKEDIEFLKTLGDNRYYTSNRGSNSYYGGSYYGNYSNNYYGRMYGYDDDDYDDDYGYGYGYHGSKFQKEDKKSDDNLLTDEVVIKYVMDKYDERWENAKEEVKKKCELLGIDYETEMSYIFDEEITF